MVKWTEVDAYSGMPVKEDAPTNFAGAGSKVAMPPDAMMKKKKKKTFLDARTKAYKEHQKRLEAARARREERKRKAAEMNEKVEYVEYKFKNKNDAMKVKKMLDGMQLMKFDINDDNINNGELIVDAGNRDMTKVHSAIMIRYKPKVTTQEEQIDEMKKVEITLNNPNDAKKIKKDVIDLTNKKRKVNITMKQMGKKLIIDGGDYDITREVKDISNFIGYKSAKVVEDIQPKTFSQKVQEQIGGFGREAFLAENNIDVIKSVVKSKGAKNLKMKDGKMMVDLFSASAIMNVYNKVNPNNKKKMEKLANGTRADLGKLQRLAMKFA